MAARAGREQQQQHRNMNQYSPYQQQQAQQQRAQQKNQPTWLFVGSPITKLFTIIIIVSYIAIEMSSNKSTTTKNRNKYKNLKMLYEMNIQKLFFNGEFGKQIYRLITGHMTFSNNSGNLLMGTGVFVYLSRKFEREMSTRKYINYIFFNFIFAMLLLFLSSFVLLSILIKNDDSQQYNIQYSGPYPMIGSLFILYHIYTPSIYPYFISVLGFNFSEKVFTYALIIQVICSSGINTILPSTCGILSGYIYTKLLSSEMTDRYLQIPTIVVNICHSISTRLLFMFYDDSPSPLWGPAYPISGGGSRGGGGGAMPLMPIMPPGFPTAAT